MFADDKCPDLLSFCKRVQEYEKSSRTAFKIPLTLTSGDTDINICSQEMYLNHLEIVGETFRELVKDYLWRGLQKGIPSLFNDVKVLYGDESKVRKNT